MQIDRKLSIKPIVIGVFTSFLLLITFATWALSSAVGSSPDEDSVLTTIWCGEHRKNIQRSASSNGDLKHDQTASENTKVTPATDFCTYDSDDYKYLLIPLLVASPQQCFIDSGQDESAACQSPQKESKSRKFFESAVDSRYIESLRIFVGTDVELSVVKMRLFNSLLAAVSIGFVSSLVWKKNSDLLLAWLAGITPVTSYFIASVNTSSWTLIGTTCFTLAFIVALKNRKRSKYWIPTVIISQFFLWFTNSSRKEGKYAIILLGAAILYSEFAPKNFKLTKKAVIMVSAILPLIYLIFGYFSKPFDTGVNVFSDRRVEVSEGITTTANNLLVNNIITLPRFITGFFGSWGLGWFELELTQTVWLFTLQAFLLIVGFALRKSSNIHRMIFGALFAMMCAAILYANQQKFGKIGEYIQPRYFLPFFLGIVIIAAANKTERYPNSLVITVAILATISNSIALRDTIRRYTTGQDVFISKSLNNPIEWWWQFGPQPETVWLTGTLAFAALWALLIYDRNKNETDTPNSPAPELTS
jgi:hypothetical protein